MKALLKISGVWKQEANGEITINTEESMLFTTAKKKKCSIKPRRVVEQVEMHISNWRKPGWEDHPQADSK